MLSKVATVVQCALLALNLIVMGLNIRRGRPQRVSA
jgi:hypothetical protein